VAGVSLGSLVSSLGLRRTLVGLMVALGPALMAYGLAPNLLLMVPALALVGGCYMGTLSTFSTIGQTQTPVEARGRVMAINNAMLGTLYPVGAVLQGWLADRVGLRAVTVASGVVMAAVLAAVAVFRRGFADPLPGRARRAAT
ncbi:MAG: hypothetical protein RLZ14_1728, partial [Actinomycetota bacterium]